MCNSAAHMHASKHARARTVQLATAKSVAFLYGGAGNRPIRFRNLYATSLFQRRASHALRKRMGSASWKKPTLNPY